MSEQSIADDRLQPWIAFSHVPGIGPARLAALISRFGSIEAAWRAPEAALAAVLDRRSLASLLATRATFDGDAAVERLRAAGARVLTLEDPAYPPQLREIPWAPFLVYVVGEVELLASRAVAIVGTRQASEYGGRAARQLARDLAAAGVTIVSGLALGIDAIAHQAALDAGGWTIAVLGSGVDVAYPARHRRLMRAIGRQGALLSEYPPGTTPDAGNFPARNRIIGGLALATIVVEAGTHSGALITARCAADQGRDVFAVPGSIYSPGSVGTNALIAAGCGVALSAEDVLAALDLSQLAAQHEARQALPADPTESHLLAHLTADPLHIDALGRATGLTIAEVSRALAMMELKGVVQHIGGMRWVAAR
jgi:DNA processing protein